MCAIKKSKEEQALSKLIKDITMQLRSLLPDVLSRTADLLSEPITSQQSLHGKIGGKNNTYANVADAHFRDFRAFQTQWAKGMLDAFKRSSHGMCRMGHITTLSRRSMP